MTNMENMKIYESLRTVDSSALKTIQAGRLKGFSDINPMWRIKKLTELFGVCGFGWRIDIVKMWTEVGADGVVAAFCHVKLFIKQDGQWSEGIDGVGGSSFIAKERAGLYTSDECYKMAYTDAIGIACKSLGMAANVYYEKDRSKYDIGVADDTKTKKDNSVIAAAIDKIKKCETIEELQALWDKAKEYDNEAGDIKQATALRHRDLHNAGK